MDAKRKGEDKEIKDIATSSLPGSTTNSALSNGATSSQHTNVDSEVECRDNSPARKRKIASDAWNAIKIILNTTLITNDQKGMTRVCAKFGVMIKCPKDKKKGTWLTSRASAHANNCDHVTQNQLIADEKSYAKENAKM